MREIVFDTETTGLDASVDRVIEIGGVEMVDRFPTGRTFHVFVNPGDRRVHPDAVRIHGITDEQLRDKPRFEAVVDDFLDFVGEDGRLVAHNASFDMGFINAELARVGRPAFENARVLDTLSLARRKHPMANNTLDALCKRYGVDNSAREKHGALLDSELLAEVYIELIGGRQTALVLDQVAGRGTREGGPAVTHPGPRPRTLPPRLAPEEVEAHAARWRDVLGEGSVWARVRRG